VAALEYAFEYRTARRAPLLDVQQDQANRRHRVVSGQGLRGESGSDTGRRSGRAPTRALAMRLETFAAGLIVIGVACMLAAAIWGGDFVWPAFSIVAGFIILLIGRRL
jgi:hypothetical protein